MWLPTLLTWVKFCPKTHSTSDVRAKPLLCSLLALELLLELVVGHALSFLGLKAQQGVVVWTHVKRALACCVKVMNRTRLPDQYCCRGRKIVHRRVFRCFQVLPMHHKCGGQVLVGVVQWPRSSDCWGDCSCPWQYRARDTTTS